MQLDALELDDRNARTHDDRNLEAIKASLERYGQVEPLIVQKGTLRVIAGHGRIEAMRAAGMKSAAVLEVDVDELGAKDLALRLNRSAELAGWNDQLLAETLRELEAAGTSSMDVGFSAAEYDELLAELEQLTEEPGDAELEDEEEELEEAEVPERCDRGQLWRLGEHRLYVGDCLEEPVLESLEIGRGGADAVITDPPYAIYGSSSGITSSVADDKMIRPFFRSVVALCREATRPFAHVYVFTDWRSYATLWEAARGRLAAKNCIVWDKGGGGMGSSWLMCHELIAYLSNLPPQKTMTSGDARGVRKVSKANILRHSRAHGDDRHHNAAKPVALLAELVEAATDEGELILDPFAGSGSTLMACELLDRRAACVEVEPRTADIILQRWEIRTGEEAELVE